MGISVTVTNNLGRVIGLIAAKHPEGSLNIKWYEGTPVEEWIVTADEGDDEQGYVVDDEAGSWAPLTENDKALLAQGKSILESAGQEHDTNDSSDLDPPE